MNKYGQTLRKIAIKLIGVSVFMLIFRQVFFYVLIFDDISVSLEYIIIKIGEDHLVVFDENEFLISKFFIRKTALFQT